MQIKALTIKQPWAHLIIHGEGNNPDNKKDVENRSWSTNHRGILAIHAGKSWDDNGEEFLQNDTVIRVPKKDECTQGAVIGLARLVHVEMYTHETAKGVNADYGVYGTVDIELESGWTASPWHEPYRYGWYLEDQAPLPEPIPCRGHQGLWNWDASDVPEDLIDQVCEPTPLFN